MHPQKLGKMLHLVSVVGVLSLAGCGQATEQTSRELHAATDSFRPAASQDDDFVAVTLRAENDDGGLNLVSRAISGYTAILSGGAECWGNQNNPFSGNAINVLRLRRNAVNCGVALTVLTIREASGDIAMQSAISSGLASLVGSTGTFATSDGQRQLQMKVTQSFKTNVDSEILLNGQDLKIDSSIRMVDKTCTTPWGTKVPDTKVTEFETLNFESAPFDNPNLTITNDTFWDTNGVRFTALNKNLQPLSSKMVIRTTTRQGEREIADALEAWLCVMCIGSPSKNRLMDAAEEARVGRHFLSTVDATRGDTAAVRVDYRVPVKELSFDLIDVDGDEVWNVQGLGADGKAIPGVSSRLVGNGYNPKTSLTGRAAQVRLTSSVPIQGVLLTGEKSINYFGFAFDNFRTGVQTDCTSP